MRRAIGLLFVSLPLGIGACAEDEAPGPYLPQIPQVPDFVETDQPSIDTLIEHPTPAQRPDSSNAVVNDVSPAQAFALGRVSRLRYDQLRAAGLLR